MWYSTGTVGFTNGSSTVTGTGTAFIGNAAVGMAIRKLGAAQLYQITGIVSATELTITPAYDAGSETGAAYEIVPIQGYLVETHAALTALLAQIDSYIDGPLAGVFDSDVTAGGGLAAASHVDVGQASGGGATGRLSGSLDRLALVPTDRAGDFDTARELSFDAAGDGLWTAEGGLRVNGALTGTAVVQNKTDMTDGRIATVGWMGLGALTPSLREDFAATDGGAGFWRYASTTSNIADAPTSSAFGMGWTVRYNENNFYEFAAVHDSETRLFMRRYRVNDGAYFQPWAELLSTEVTTVDANGFIKEASPIVRLYDSGTEEPVQPVGAVFAKPGTGQYVLSGVPPLAASGWQIEVPQDHNGNRLVFVETGHDAETGVMTVTTSLPVWSDGWVAGTPIDIPAGRWVDLRLDAAA